MHNIVNNNKILIKINNKQINFLKDKNLFNNVEDRILLSRF
jgi:hypothetical protein